MSRVRLSEENSRNMGKSFILTRKAHHGDHAEEHTKFENLVRYGSTKDGKFKPAIFNSFADLKGQLEDKK